MKIAILSCSLGYEDRQFIRAVRVSEKTKDIGDLPELTPEILKRAGIDEEIADEWANEDADSEARWLGLEDAEMLPIIGEHRPYEVEQCRFVVATYFGSGEGSPAERYKKEEFDAPNVPMLVAQADGIRIVLGSHDWDDLDKPDIQIERRPSGWCIFPHPIGGHDEPGFLYFHDDGRSWFCHHYPQFPEPTTIVEYRDEHPKEIDELPTEGANV